MNNNKTKITNVVIGGIKRPQVHVYGTKNGNDEVVIFADSKEIPFIDKGAINRAFVFQKYMDNYEFNYTADLKFNNKKVEIGIRKGKSTEIVCRKNCGLIYRITNKITFTLKKIIKVIIKVPKVIYKVIKISWTRHHFLVPPRLIKQYIKSFRNNMSSESIEDIFYSPLKQSDYLKWLDENKVETTYNNYEYNPLISILVPVYNVSRTYLSECINSVINQTYKNWELCLADDCSNKEETINTLKEYEKLDSRIKVVYRKENGHISEATNSALKLATGEFIGLLDNDDVLHKDALYEVVSALNKDRNIDMIYTDEDKININGKRYYPHFKPDFSPDTLLSINYICHFTILRRNIVNEIGGFRKKYDGSQDYDLFLRFTEKTKNIHHIPKVLYHWRETKGSTSMGVSNKNYAYLAGQKALEDALKRRNIEGNVIPIKNLQMYVIEYKYKKEPKISIIIPTKDKVDMLKACIDSIYKKTLYKNFEIIVIDNNSVEEETKKFLKEYKKKHNNFKYYRYECEFNYSYLNNEAIKKATGEYIVLLNNDTEVITPKWLSYMVGYAMQKHVGCVGAKLLYKNNTIQHCGVVTGVAGVASHVFLETGMLEYGYFGRLIIPYNYSAVTAACLMIKKSVFNEASGLDENLKVAYNDVDLSVRIRKMGYYNVVLPQVLLYHYESISRGSDLADDKVERFKNEIKYITKKLNKDLMHDEFYNDNFSKDCCFVLDKKEKEEDESK